MKTASLPVGSLALEAVIALALLTTAMVALAKYARSSAELQVQADGRVAARLACENVLSRIDGVGVGEVGEEIKRSATAVEALCGCRITVTADPFAAEGVEGVHLVVQSRPKAGQPITLHDWVLRPPQSSADDGSDGADSDEADSDGAGDDAN